MIGDNYQREWDKHHMNVTPGTEDRVRDMLPVERLCQAGMVFQGGIRALKIGLLAEGQRWKPGRKIAHALDCLGAIRLERLGLSRTETFYDVFQFEETARNGFRNADTIGAGIPGNRARLPLIEK